MNADQTRLYFREWNLVRRHLLAKGIDPKQADNRRHELHRRALGADKSSKDLTNADFDKVLAAFRAVHDGANLDAQLRQLEQPEYRRKRMMSRCWVAARSFIKGDDDEHTYALILRYLDDTADRMFGRRYEDLDRGQQGDAQLSKVMGALERTARVRKAKAEKNPF